MSKSWGEIRDEALRRCGQKPPMTNADKIRAMTDEELANWVNFHTDCENCPNRKCEDSYTTSPDSCVKSLLAWLKSTVEVDG